jgi:aspartate aminotransferase-like enzyme
VAALETALCRYEAEGPASVWKRHQAYAGAIAAAAATLGLKLFSAAGAHSRTVVAIAVPRGVDAQRLLQTLHERWGVVLSPGQQELAGKIIRIGTMGDLSRSDIIGALGALELALRDQYHQTGAGAIEAATNFLAAMDGTTRDAGSKSDSKADAQTMEVSR